MSDKIEGWDSYNVKYTNSEGKESWQLYPYSKPKSPLFARIAVILLILANLFQAFVGYKQASVIRYQRDVIRELVIYIEQGCPAITEN